MISGRMLHQLAQEAIKRGLAELAQWLVVEIPNITEEEHLARWIIQQIPHRTELEARIGRRQTAVMVVADNDYDRPSDDKRRDLCLSSWLRGVCMTVYTYCLEAGLNPTLDSCYDSITGEWVFNITIHW